MFRNKSLSKNTYIYFFFKEGMFLSNLHGYKTLKAHFAGVLFLVNVGTKAKHMQ